MLSAPDQGTALGAAARQRALQTHDPRQNAGALTGIYRQILAQLGREAAL